MGFGLILRKETFLQTRDVDGGSSINHATIWADTVSAWCGCLDFKTHISFCGVGELQVSSDDVCKGPWETHRETAVTQSDTGIRY